MALVRKARVVRPVLDIPVGTEVIVCWWDFEGKGESLVAIGETGEGGGWVPNDSLEIEDGK